MEQPVLRGGLVRAAGDRLEEPTGKRRIPPEPGDDARRAEERHAALEIHLGAVVRFERGIDPAPLAEVDGERRGVADHRPDPVEVSEPLGELDAFEAQPETLARVVDPEPLDHVVTAAKPLPQEPAAVGDPNGSEAERR